MALIQHQRYRTAIPIFQIKTRLFEGKIHICGFPFQLFLRRKSKLFLAAHDGGVNVVAHNDIHFVARGKTGPLIRIRPKQG